MEPVDVDATQTELPEGEEGEKPIAYEKEVVLYKLSDYLG